MICDNCANYDYDEENECYYCSANLDEDDIYRFLAGDKDCPFYNSYDEYKIVEKQN